VLPVATHGHDPSSYFIKLFFFRISSETVRGKVEALPKWALNNTTDCRRDGWSEQEAAAYRSGGIEEQNKHMYERARRS
jgi:hypothetical protein